MSRMWVASLLAAVMMLHGCGGSSPDSLGGTPGPADPTPPPADPTPPPADPVFRSSDPDELIDRASRILAGDPSIRVTTDEELDEFFAPSSTPEAVARARRLAHNHELVIGAVDPDPEWFRTEASAQMIITTAGDHVWVDLHKVDIDGRRLGPVDVDRLRLEVRVQRDVRNVDYVPAEFHHDFVRWSISVPGRLDIDLPPYLDRGRLIIGVRPDFADRGQEAIAERWSVGILVDVWPRQPNVFAVTPAEVYYPMDLEGALRAASAFDEASIAAAMSAASADDTLAEELLKPLVVRGRGLREGDLIDYRIPDPTGGFYPYGGRVLRAIAGADQQQLLLLNFDLPSVYDIVLDAEDDLLIREGVSPEFVTYRSGDPIDRVRDEPDLPTHFGPEERIGIQSAPRGRLFDTDCKAGSVAVAITPFIKFDGGFDAGIEYSFGLPEPKIECTIESTAAAMWPVPIGGPVGALLQRITGTGLLVGPYGAIKVAVEAADSPVNINLAGGASVQRGIGKPEFQFPMLKPGYGLEGSAWVIDMNLGGETGLKAILSAVKFAFLSREWDVSLEAKAVGQLGTSATIANAAGAYRGNDSEAAITVGFVVEAKASAGLEQLLQFFRANFELVATYAPPPAEWPFPADYGLGDVSDGGQGYAHAEIHARGRMREFLRGNSGGYASLDGSSVFNDLNMAITYDLEECEDRGGVIETPFVGCVGDWFCARLKEQGRLCGTELIVSPVLGSGYVGDTVTTEARVEVRRGGDADTPLQISVSGSPLTPAGTAFQLRPGGSESFEVSAQCAARGVRRGNITAMAGAQNTSAQNLLTCNCRPGDRDCDRTWLSPHLLTADGLAYDYIASGDYILQRLYDGADRPAYGIEIQARFLPGYDVSWPQAVALQVGDDVVEVQAASYKVEGVAASTLLYVWVNGEIQGPPQEWHAIREGSRTLHLPSGGLVYLESFAGRFQGRYWDPNRLTVLWPQGEFEGYAVQLSTAYFPEREFDYRIDPFLEIQMIRPATPAGFTERGMLGTNDGDPATDFTRRNGQVLGQDAAMSFTALYALFGGDWLVRPHECLFRDGCIRKPDFPTRAASLTPEQRALGEAACAHLTGYYKEACIHDVGLSGSVELVRDYYANATDLNYMADRLQTPGVDLPVYTVARGSREYLPEHTLEAPVYRQGASVEHILGEGAFLLNLRPPRDASTFFAAGHPGALTMSYTDALGAGGQLETAIEVRCGEPDPQWAEFRDFWPRMGAVQLGALDPLSGFASAWQSEFPLSCIVTGLRHATRISTNGASRFAIDGQGRLWAWGSNLSGQLGDGTITDRPTPVVVDLSALGGAELVSVVSAWWGAHSLALDDEGRVWAWGNNASGELGDGTNTTRWTPVAVDLSSLDGTPVVFISGRAQGSLAVDDRGRLWVWGGSWSGYFGLEGPWDSAFLTPVAVDLPALGGAAVMSVAQGRIHDLALDDQGRVWAWGTNQYGQLGDGTGGVHAPIRRTPVAVDLSALDGAAVVSVVAGGYHSMALDDQGRLWAWGRNSSGQLGDGTGAWYATDRLTPVLVDLSALDGAAVVSIEAGGEHSMALDDQGRLWAWGSNFYGQLGDGTHTQRSTPVAVDLSALGGAAIVSVVSRTSENLALDDEGRVWTWGSPFSDTPKPLPEIVFAPQTPDVDLPYALVQGSRENLPESTPRAIHYWQRVIVEHVLGDGAFMLNLRPPRNASAFFAAGHPGALKLSYTGVLGAGGRLETAIEVRCEEPDPQWAGSGDFWPRMGAVQLWALDPLSGFASTSLGELMLSCGADPINDTGIDWCADAANNYDLGDSALKTTRCAAVTIAGFPGQDGHHGRDALARAGSLPKLGDGTAGFDFTKISNSGTELPASATLGSGPNDWACTRDNVTGLIWEVKVDDIAHMRHQHHSYTWYDPDRPDGSRGIEDKGTCVGSTCDTTGFVRAVNAQGMCGSSNWRMPTWRELQGIVNYGGAPGIDTEYFPNTPTYRGFWSGSPNASIYHLNSGWILYAGGRFGYTSPGDDSFVRLMRGGQ